MQNAKNSIAPKAIATQKAAAKKGQKAKVKAVVLPVAPKGTTGAAVLNTSAVKAGVKPSLFYPQGNVTVQVLPLPAGCSSKQRANHAAFSKALGSTKGSLISALANGGTRRHLRQLWRYGLLVQVGSAPSTVK